ncbi:hypothetical protein HDU86_002851 [Geranomyces michiganensis]|nr:hypothetical protein HDU86_002851 [Geranomyces michiganensis]
MSPLRSNRYFTSKMDTPSSSAAPSPSQIEAGRIRAIEETLPWISFPSETHSALKDFLAAWPPSSTSQSDVAWVCVCNSTNGNTDEDRDLNGLANAWDQLIHQEAETTAGGSVVTENQLDCLARRFHVLSGKWLVFRSLKAIDKMWNRISRATVAGTLGTAAKVAPRSDNGTCHVVCIYTRDYTDAADVARVRDALRRLGVTERIVYKPDLYTRCEIYKRNPWGIKPSRFAE